MPDESELAVHSSAKTNNGFELAAIRVAAVQNARSGLSLCSTKPAETVPETILERENGTNVLSSLSEASAKETNHSFVAKQFVWKSRMSVWKFVVPNRDGSTPNEASNNCPGVGSSAIADWLPKRIGMANVRIILREMDEIDFILSPIPVF